MFEEHIMPFLMTRFEMRQRHSIDIRIGGMPESDVDDVLREFGFPDGMECIINVAKGEIIVKLRGFELAVLEEYAEKVRARFEKNFIGYGDENVAKVLLRLLKEKGLTLSTAESCTGGLIGKELTDIPGSSSVFMGGIIAYSNDVKVRILRVPQNILEKHGAVSEECAKAMAVGACNILHTKCSLSVTGVAGPDGGTEEKPVGTVCIAYCIANNVVTKKYDFAGDREAIRVRTMKTALREMGDMIKQYQP
jgi:nicotinamide-nucleotide amidase